MVTGDIQRYKKDGIFEEKNIQAPVSTMPFEMFDARLARMALVVRGEWQYDDRAGAACSVATALASASIVALAGSVATKAVREFDEPPTAPNTTTRKRI